MKEISSVEEFKKSIQSGKVMVLFTGSWCPDCMVIKPFMPQIAQKYSEYEFYQVNRDHVMDVFVENDVFGIPSFIAYNEGNEQGRFV
ncbi:MAG: thioredoxin family protein, partial [Turicibacter sp.]